MYLGTSNDASSPIKQLDVYYEALVIVSDIYLYFSWQSGNYEA